MIARAPALLLGLLALGCGRETASPRDLDRDGYPDLAQLETEDDRAAFEWPKIEKATRESIELERGYQRQAMAAYERALASPIPLSKPSSPGVLTYLVGETARRLGEANKARQFFEMTARVSGAPRWMLDWAKEQAALLPAPSK